MLRGAASELVGRIGRPYHPGMMRDVRVHLSPALFEPDELRGGLAVVIDLLRASTTIVHALAAGADRVVPCLEVDEARAYAANHPGESLVLGGERGGRLIEGFDLDNSPLRYTAERVSGRTVVFTTTNGTRALLRSREADRVLVGAFVNLNAVLALLARDGRPVHLVCAGTRGRFSAEDCLCAGTLATGLAAAAGVGSWTDDAACVAMDFYRARSGSRSEVLEALFQSLGGRDLRELGYDADVERSAAWDLFTVVPEFFPATGHIGTATDAGAPDLHWVAPPPV